MNFVAKLVVKTVSSLRFLLDRNRLKYVSWMFFLLSHLEQLFVNLNLHSLSILLALKTLIPRQLL